MHARAATIPMKTICAHNKIRQVTKTSMGVVSHDEKQEQTMYYINTLYK